MLKRKRKSYKEVVRVKTVNGEYLLKPSKGLEDKLIKAWEGNSIVWCEELEGARVKIDCKLLEGVTRVKDYKPKRNIATDIELDGLTFILVMFVLCTITACVLSLIWRM